MIAELIKKARKDAGLNQTELAEKVGLRQINITRLESGNYNPHWETVGVVVAALGYGLKEFLNKYAPDTSADDLIKMVDNQKDKQRI